MFSHDCLVNYFFVKKLTVTHRKMIKNSIIHLRALDDGVGVAFFFYALTVFKCESVWTFHGLSLVLWFDGL